MCVVCQLELLELGTAPGPAMSMQPADGPHPPRAPLEETGQGPSTWQGLLSPHGGSSHRGNRTSSCLAEAKSPPSVPPQATDGPLRPHQTPAPESWPGPSANPVCVRACVLGRGGGGGGGPTYQAGCFGSWSFILSPGREQLESSTSIQSLAWSTRGQRSKFFPVSRVPTSPIILLLRESGDDLLLKCKEAAWEPQRGEVTRCRTRMGQQGCGKGKQSRAVWEGQGQAAWDLCPAVLWTVHSLRTEQGCG